MKSFFQFLSEAKTSKAADQARRLGLTGDGHGGWYDNNGEFVAKTEKGELKFYNKGQRPGQDPPQNRTQSNQQPVATQTQPSPAIQKGASTEPQQDLPSDDVNQEVSLTITFGRFNPPTVGHEKLLKAARRIAGPQGNLLVFPSRTQDKKKNPLSPSEKINFMKKMFPDFEELIVDDEEMKSIFNVLVSASQQGYRIINIVVGADRKTEFENLANKYNGDLYEFDEINVVSAGARDADAEGIEGMSASKMRKAAAEDDYNTFKRGIPNTLDDAGKKRMYNKLRSAMGVKTVKENYNLWEIAPKIDPEGLRENYISNKIFNVGDIVENLNTGLVGKIKRRGPNYLICVNENDLMFKSWIRDVMEAEVEVPSKNLKKLVKKSVSRVDSNIDGFIDKEDDKKKVGPYGAFLPQPRNIPKYFKMKEWTDVSGVPADQRLVGTDSHREYVMRMVDTKKIKNFINKYKAKK
jgi:phosphopantetheine adenylyltransferase